MPWDSQSTASQPISSTIHHRASTSQLSANNGSRSSPVRSGDAYRHINNHPIAVEGRTIRSRSDSGATGGNSSLRSHNAARRIGSESQIPAVRPLLVQPRARLIPPPQVTIRSEFPTLTRSRQQQTVTCLVTVEVPKLRNQRDVEGTSDTAEAASYSSQGRYARPPSPAHSSQRSLVSQEALDNIAVNLRSRVEDWHTLEFERYGIRYIETRLHN